MLAVTVRDGDRSIDHRMCLLHESRVRDRGRLAGARHARDGQHDRGGEGGVRPRAPGACACTTSAAAAAFPGAKGNPNPMYRVPLLRARPRTASAGAGGRQRAGRARAHGGGGQRAQHQLHRRCKMRDFQAVQLRVGARRRADRRRAAECCAGTAMRPSDIAHGKAARRRSKTKLRFKRNARVRDGAVHRGGGHRCTRWPAPTASTTAYPIQRIFRDAHALAGHISFSWDAQGGPWALVAMGGEFNSPTM